MAHDVFVSHSSKDKTIADGVCAALEAAGIRCWIAPRDILPGKPFPEAIIEAVSASRIMVLIFSANANTSKPVANELSLAMNANVIVIPFKIDDILPEGPLKFWLANTHWLDAMNPPTEKQIQELVETVGLLMKKGGEHLLSGNKTLKKRGKRRWLWLAGALALSAALLAVFFTVDPFGVLPAKTIEEEPPPALQATKTGNDGVPAVIFAEDFQSGTFTNLRSTSGWTLVAEEDGYSLEGRGHAEYSPLQLWSEHHQTEWRDVTVAFRFKLISNYFDFDIRENRSYEDNKYVYSRYSLQIGHDSIGLTKFMWNGTTETSSLVSVNRYLRPDRWYALKVSPQGNNIKVYLDNELIIDYHDENDPILLGTFGWGGGIDHGGRISRFLIDDIVATRELLPGSEVTLSPQEQVYIPSIMATVQGLRFFASYGEVIVPLERRQYDESFSAGTTRFIWWELYLAREAGPRTAFRIYAEYYCPDGELIHTATVDDLWIDHGWTESLHTAGIGYPLPGNWEPGIYEVKLFHTDTLIASGEFRIVSGD